MEDHRGTFTPFVTSVDGLLHREAEHFPMRMATCVASKWKKSYAHTCGYIRARLSFAIIREASLSLRGSRVKWRRGLGFDRSLLNHALSRYSLNHLLVNKLCDMYDWCMCVLILYINLYG